MKKKQTHFYRVIAHLDDGDIEIFPMKKKNISQHSLNLTKH